MKRIIIFMMALIPGLVMGHGGEDHSHAGGTTSVESALKSSSSFAVSDKYEALIKYDVLEKNNEGNMQLYISEFQTNKPIDDATLTVVAANNNRLKFSARHIGTGTYEIRGVFPENGTYALNIIIQSAKGPDMLVLENIIVGKPLLSGSPVQYHTIAISGLVGVVVGAVIALFVLLFKRKKVRPEYAAIAIILLSLPLSTSKSSAHGTESHDNNAANPLVVIVPKETQFLYGIETSVNKYGEFHGTREFQGEIIPGQNGLAVVESPQTGKIISLNALVGQKVKKGQVVATIQQSIDAATQLSMMSQFNGLSEEVKAAKIQFERLKSIADITAKRDLLEAESRYRIAKKNLELMRRNLSTGAGNIIRTNLTAPIDGVVGPFTYSIGSIMNAGETLFTITNLESVLVAVQVEAKDSEEFVNAKEITIRSEDGSTTGVLKKVSEAQFVNAANQTSRYLFEIKSNRGKFKLGQKVIVSSVSSKPSREIVISNKAIVEVNGKTAYFVKEGPESFRIEYTKALQNNADESIVAGARAGDRIVSVGSFEMKTMFLNQ